jgi:hypothetical protein
MVRIDERDGRFLPRFAQRLDDWGRQTVVMHRSPQPFGVGALAD